MTPFRRGCGRRKAGNSGRIQLRINPRDDCESSGGAAEPFTHLGRLDMKTVPLHGGKAAGRVALVDDEDYDLVMQYRWYVYEEIRSGRPHGPYALAWPSGVTTRMHVLITGIRGVDHANRNGLDNRRENLRPATRSQNQANRRSHLGSSSRYKGVSWHKRRGKWVASIRPTGGPSRHLGLFAEEDAAARAYDAAAREAFGPFACLNFPAMEAGPL